MHDTIPAPPPSGPRIAPSAAYALWLVGAPGASTAALQQAVRGQR